MKSRSDQEGEREGKHKSNTSSNRLRIRKSGNTQKGDSSKTSISERRRQGSMKEKLYELGALVPNITKMDKASILGGATTYMQELQMRARKLQAQVADFEDSEVDRPQQPSDQTPTKISAGNSYSSTSKKITKRASLEELEVDKPKQPSFQTPKMMHAVNSNSTSKRIAKMDVDQLGGRGVNVKVVCNKGKGVAVSLYKALESFTSLDIESSKLVTVPEGFELTFSFKVGIKEVNVEKLKLGLAGAFLNHGFDFKTSPQP